MHFGARLLLERTEGDYVMLGTLCFLRSSQANYLLQICLLVALYYYVVCNVRKIFSGGFVVFARHHRHFASLHRKFLPSYKLELLRVNRE